jgi:sugar transferase (PEP-CTERM/EpsH1 system associated)
VSAAPPRPKILFLAHLLPWPLEGGGQIKSFHTLRLLSAVADIRLLAFVRREGECRNAETLAPLCREGIRLIPLPRSRVTDMAAAVSALMTRTTFLVSRDAAPAMHSAVREELITGRYAGLHVDHLQMAQFVTGEIGKARVVLDCHNVEHLLVKRLVETAGVNPVLKGYATREWHALREFERRAVQRADLVLTVSPMDAGNLRALAPDRSDRVVTVPIGVDTEYFRPIARGPLPKSLLFVGTLYWPPNVDSLRYLCREILPRIRAHIPDVRLRVVGIRPTVSVRALAADPSVTVVGHVPDIRPYAADCGAFVVPLRWGSGMRVKILNAMAMGLPVVSTTVGAEGIDITDGQDVLIADEPDAFADAVVRVLNDPTLGGELGTAARHLMETRYTWEVIGPQLLSAYAERVLAPSGATEGR